MEMTRTNRSRRLAAKMLAVLAVALPAVSVGQSQSLGTISVRIVDDRGVIVPDATLTLSRGGVDIRIEQADVGGRFTLVNLLPGEYSLLAEQVGYQPVRTVGIAVVAGTETRVAVRLERRPPPITSVTEVRHQAASHLAGSVVRRGSELSVLARRNDATTLAEDFSGGFASGDGRGGFGLGANGLVPRHSRLVVDGVEELLLRHPAMPGEGARAPLFARQEMSQASYTLTGFDPEVPDGGGATLSLLSREHRGAFTLRPWLSYSGSSLGGSSLDNPADSSGSAIQAGAVMGGGFRGDSGSWGLSIEYRSITEPTSARYAPGSERIAAIAEAAGATDVSPWTAPTVRGWSGVRATGNLAWQMASNARIAARLGVASWNEDNPLLATATNGAGSSLEANDISGMTTFEYWSEEWRSETRVGYQSSSRDWSGAGRPYTTLVADQLSLGTAPVLPGNFSERRLSATETITFPMEAFDIRLGGGVARRQVTHDWLLDGEGRASFGSLEDLAAGFGSWTATSSSNSEVEFALTELSAFGEVDWKASPSITLTAAARYEAQSIPTDLVSPAPEFGRVFGLANFVVPTSKSSAIGPRGAITFDAGARGTTIVRIAGGLIPGRHDLAALAEAAHYDGSVTRRRALGEIGWPGAPSAAVTESTPITMYGLDVRAPRSFVLNGSLSQAIAPGTVLDVSGGYSHTDYLLRRGDLNRPVAPLATGDGGRAIWGSLEQHGSMIVATPGSNRRFEDFDNVWFLTSSGYADNRHATVSLRHLSPSGLRFGASYTWSKTEDNLLNQLSADPGDRAIVVGTGVGDARWDIGRSDLDIPHRAVVHAGYQLNDAFHLAARFRWRSGLPFTPGFPAGVDANGDGSSGNDPVSLGAVAGLRNTLESAGCSPGSGDIVERNSCREDAVQALDIEAGVRLPIGSARAVMLTISAFNLVSSDVGIVDRAAVRVDPDGTIGTDASGRLVLPLVINENFGELLVRRNDPRTVRLGLRVEY